MYIKGHQALQNTMTLPNMISMQGYEELLGPSHGCSSSFALSRYDERTTLIRIKTDQLHQFGERFVYFGVSAPLQNYIQ